jgi:hypothetical protein
LRSPFFLFLLLFSRSFSFLFPFLLRFSFPFDGGSSVSPVDICVRCRSPIVVEQISFDCPRTVEDGRGLCSTFCCVEFVRFTACVL